MCQICGVRSKFSLQSPVLLHDTTKSELSDVIKRLFGDIQRRLFRWLVSAIVHYQKQLNNGEEPRYLVKLNRSIDIAVEEKHY